MDSHTISGLFYSSTPLASLFLQTRKSRHAPQGTGLRCGSSPQDSNCAHRFSILIDWVLRVWVKSHAFCDEVSLNWPWEVCIIPNTYDIIPNTYQIHMTSYRIHMTSCQIHMTSYQTHMTSYQHRFISLLDALKLNLVVETVVWKFLCSVVLILPETVPNRSSLLTVHKLLTSCRMSAQWHNISFTFTSDV